MNGRDFLNVADALVTGLTEADWRSAISRAYYATFHVARQVLRQCGFQVPNADQAHAYLWLRLSNAGHPDVKGAGLNLRYLRKVRNWADYDVDLSLNQSEAMTQFQAATDIIQLLEQVAAEPAVRTRITETIKIYERDVLREVTWHA